MSSFNSKQFCLPIFSCLVLLAFPAASVFGEAVTCHPGDDIQAAVDSHPAGTTFRLTPGIYRLQQVNPKNGDTFIGQPGAILNGARLVTSFAQETVGGATYWVALGPSGPGQIHGSCDADRPTCIYPEDFFIDDQPLTRVLSLDNVATGKCFFDYSQAKIYFRYVDDPTRHRVEVSAVRHAFGAPSGVEAATNVTVRGLVIEKYAIPADMGAVGDQYGGDSWTVENNEIRLNHGAGVLATTRAVVRGNYIHDNGHLGITGTGTGSLLALAPDILLENNEVARNSYGGFSYGWGSGGIKISAARNLVVRNNYVHDNIGAGLWTDGYNLGTLYENNRVEANRGIGIWHEISYDVVIRYNTLIRNGLWGHPWLYQSQILIANSSNAEIYNNLAVVDGDLGTSGQQSNGIAILQQDRSVDGPDFYTIHNSIHDNVVTYLGDRGQSGGGADTLPGDPYDPRIMFNGNNLFDYNVYHAPRIYYDPGAPGFNGMRWDWACDPYWDCWLDWAGFQAQGQEPHGVADTNVPPLGAAPPSIPTNLVAVAVSGTQMNLTWEPSVGPAGVAGYRIFRDGVPCAMTLTTSWVDTELRPSTSYTYTVAAFNAVATTSDPSASATATTLGPNSTGGPRYTAVRHHIRILGRAGKLEGDFRDQGHRQGGD